MAWLYSSATFVGNKADPQPGASVTITLEEASDPESVETRELAWGFDGSQTKGEFVKMVRGEIKAHLQHLNAGSAAADATPEFQPV